MRILEVLHFFLPKHSAGTEVYTDSLVQELARRGHDVHLFFSEKVLSSTNYSLQQREHHGIPCHVVINNLLYDSFRETFENPEIEHVFNRVLDAVKPDVIHFQHLMLLSLGLPRIAKARGIPTVMTLQLPIPTFTTTLGVGQPVQIQLPSVNLQRVRTTVTMPDGATLMIGGWKVNEDRDLGSGVPFLMNIPGLSPFFSRKGKFLNKEKLLILVKAKIVIPEESEPIVRGGFGR